jgi:nucleoside-diphosphate-sugar epimerase
MSSQPERVLVTGATGFIGSRLVERLLEQGAALNIVVRRRTDSVDAWERRGVTVFEHDGTTERMLALVAESKPDVAYHLATHFVARHTAVDVEPLVRSNVVFGGQLLEALCAAGVTRLVNVGSAWQHHLGDDYRPVSLYAATKQAFESLLAYYCDAHAMHPVSLHLSDSYGPTDQRVKLLTLLRRAATSGSPLRMSPGMQRIDLVHVEDVVNALLVAGKRTASPSGSGVHEIFRVSTERPLTLREVVSLYEQVLGTTIPVEWGTLPYRLREVMEPWEGGTKLPGWVAGIALEDGLRELAG